MIEFDDQTLLNINKALERACTALPVDKDTADGRKAIADAIVAAASAGEDTLARLTAAGRKALADLINQ